MGGGQWNWFIDSVKKWWPTSKFRCIFYISPLAYVYFFHDRPTKAPHERVQLLQYITHCPFSLTQKKMWTINSVKPLCCNLRVQTWFFSSTLMSHYHQTVWVLQCVTSYTTKHFFRACVILKRGRVQLITVIISYELTVRVWPTKPQAEEYLDN